ncbi:MAG: Rpp14/Pop5 family protein [Candidatus Micrarchaeota archaeon]
MREKKRYLLLKIESPQPFLAEEAKRLAYSAVFELLGEAGASRAGFALKEFNESKQQAIVRCANASSLEQVIAALAAKRFYEGKDVAIRLLRVSGMIGKLSEQKQ